MLNQIKAELCDVWGGDKNVAHAAWASSYDLEKVEAKGEDAIRKVVTGIVLHDHGTPKERVWMEFYIVCPIFCERQFDKYRLTTQVQDVELAYKPGWLQKLANGFRKWAWGRWIIESWFGEFGRQFITQNELSGRYRTIPDRPFTAPTDVTRIVGEGISREFNNMVRDQHDFYQDWLVELKAKEVSGAITNAQYKRAREVLRGVLGTAYLTDMRIVLNGNAFEWIVNQRLAPESQLESRVVAYYMVRQAEEAGVINTMVAEMKSKNGWDKWMAEVEEALRGEHVSSM